MDRMIFLAMSAARQTMNGQAQAANNLANANTTGFKADFDAYRAMPLFGAGHPTRVFALAERPGVDFSTGTIEMTGNDLDVALNGEGFIAVQAPDGSEVYTRAGEFRIDANGQLLTMDGLPVLGNGGPIALPPSQAVVIGTDGTISTRPIGQEANTLAQIDRLRLVRPLDLAQVVKGADGLFRQKDGTPMPIDAAVTVTQGALERSNVNPVGEMITMIENARQYEMAVKAMDTAQTLDAEGARVLRL
ncbi:MAG TPA: flagellar basal-body rod protein FlgF [Gammaproteobacteria bacterium]|nr:flagellar basal-body rod protein FlgF [Gammaproteobacteria bacterium]